jgi:hypothetical protein
MHRHAPVQKACLQCRSVSPAVIPWQSEIPLPFLCRDPRHFDNWKRRAITTEVGPYRWHTHTLNVLDCVWIGDGELCSSLLFYWISGLITTEVGPYRWHTHTLNVFDCVWIGDGELYSFLLVYWISKLNDIFKIISFGGLTDLPTGLLFIMNRWSES